MPRAVQVVLSKVASQDAEPDDAAKENAAPAAKGNKAKSGARASPKGKAGAKKAAAAVKPRGQQGTKAKRVAKDEEEEEEESSSDVDSEEASGSRAAKRKQAGAKAKSGGRRRAAGGSDDDSDDEVRKRATSHVYYSAWIWGLKLRLGQCLMRACCFCVVVVAGEPQLLCTA